MQNLGLILLLTLSPLELYKDAKKGYTQGDFDGASKKVERFLIQYPDHELTPYILYWAGRLRKDQKEAMSYYEKVLTLYPESKVADSALYRIAQYFYAKGEYIEALRNYEKVVTSYPKGLYAQSAKEWIATIYSFQSRQVGTEQPSADTFKYAIQVGAFQKEKNAEKFKESLNKFTPYIVNEDNHYKVMIGEFSSSEDAKKFMIENELKGFIIKRTK